MLPPIVSLARDCLIVNQLLAAAYQRSASRGRLMHRRDAIAARISWKDTSAEVMASTRKAIGGTKLDQMRTFSAHARIQRNVGNMQMTSDTKLLLEMPDKYFRSDSVSGGPIAILGTERKRNADRIYTERERNADHDFTRITRIDTDRCCA